MLETDATHDPARRSFVEAANLSHADFPLQNLPFGIFKRGEDESSRGGVAIGDQIFDLAAAQEAGLFSGLAEKAAIAARGPTLNPLMALGNRAASALRARLCNLLDAESHEREKVEPHLVPMSEASMQMPVAVGNFTDFLTSSFHSERLSPTGKVPPSFKSMPIAYHSRASSVRVGAGSSRGRMANGSARRMRCNSGRAGHSTTSSRSARSSGRATSSANPSRSTTRVATSSAIAC